MRDKHVINLSDDTFTEPEIIELLTSENNDRDDDPKPISPWHTDQGAFSIRAVPSSPLVVPKQSSPVKETTPSSPIITYERPAAFDIDSLESSSQVRKPKAIVLSSPQQLDSKINVDQNRIDTYKSQFDSSSPIIPASLKLHRSSRDTKRTHIENSSPLKKQSPPASFHPRSIDPVDPIEDSSFNFSQSQPSNKSTLADLVKWLSDSDDDSFAKDSHSVRKPTDLPTVLEKTEKPLENVSVQQPVVKEKSHVPRPSTAPKVISSKKPVNEKLVNPFSNYEYTAKELKEANRITRKKEELLAEMIIHIPRSLGFEKELVYSLFEHSTVESYNCDVPLIYWKRKVDATYDSSRDIFVPCAPMDVQQKTLVLHFNANELLNKIRKGTIKLQVDKALSLAKLRQPILKYSVIIVMEGYDQYILKLKNAENKRYKDEVLKRLNESTQSKKRRTEEEEEEEEEITAKEANYLVNKCQLELGINIFPTRSNKETLEWLLSFTYTIAQSLYDKYERNSSLANLGTVRSGTDPKSTFLQTIRQFKMMTEPKTDKLYGSFQSIYSIYTEFENNGTLGKDSYGKNVVPPTTDSAMKRAFLGDDPNEVINE